MLQVNNYSLMDLEQLMCAHATGKPDSFFDAPPLQQIVIIVTWQTRSQEHEELALSERLAECWVATSRTEALQIPQKGIPHRPDVSSTVRAQTVSMHPHVHGCAFMQSLAWPSQHMMMQTTKVAAGQDVKWNAKVSLSGRALALVGD